VETANAFNLQIFLKRELLMDMPVRFTHAPVNKRTQEKADYSEFEAAELYCPKCKRAVPVIKSLLLVLPGGDKYEYRCKFCGTPVGEKIDHSGQFYSILKT